METLSHSALSVAHLLRARPDAAVVFNSANAALLPVLRAAAIPVATHVDGLEWKRSKWGPTGRRYYRGAESLAVRWSDALIADAVGIQDYYDAEFGAPTHLITYGSKVITERNPDVLGEFSLEPYRYHLVVARFEPENHVDRIVEGYRRSSATLPLVVVGSAPYSDAYTSRVHFLADERVRFLGGVWNQDVLDQLYANTLTYLHGHSVGGTNPSLLRAIGAGAACLAYDVGFNREVLEGARPLLRHPGGRQCGTARGRARRRGHHPSRQTDRGPARRTTTGTRWPGGTSGSASGWPGRDNFGHDPAAVAPGAGAAVLRTPVFAGAARS